ncbi:hypothetical protein AAF712_002300 [Marasmius tenuissimus]|uniref:DUF6699 domain-containing protein n=1 Tax=Marasmius tenuissimus TaxID=585030 RepID=A0ABR3A9T6_9AGAR
MSDQPGTPFIPPLGTPSPAGGLSSRPGIGTPRHSSGQLPYSPRTESNTGYIPGHSPNEYPSTIPGGLSSDYTGYPVGLPPTPSSHSTTPLRSPHHELPNSSMNWPPGAPPGAGPYGTPYQAPAAMPPFGGYPHPAAFGGPYGGASPFVPPMAMMGTPYAPGAWPLPPLHPGHTPYHGGGAPLPPHGHGHGHGPQQHQAPPPQPPPPPPQQGPQAWMYGGYGGMGMFPGMGGMGGMYDMSAMQGALPGGPPPPAAAAGGPGGPLGRAAEQGMDQISHWSAGAHYGTVLEPFLTQILNVKLQINPLLAPSQPDSDQPFLKWSMLFPSNMCQRSGDADHVSWHTGRNEPATFPRVTKLTLCPSVSTMSLRNAASSIHANQHHHHQDPQFLTQEQLQTPLPFMIDINASKPDIGVTCGDVIDGIYVSLYQMSGGKEFNVFPADSPLRKVVAHAYRHNRSRTQGVPGGGLGDGLRRLDWMGIDVYFGGVRAIGGGGGGGAEHTIRRVCGFGRGGTFNNDPDDRLSEDDLPADNPCTFELLCVRRRPMTREEAAKEREEQERARADITATVPTLNTPSAAEARRERRRSRASDGGNIFVQPPTPAPGGVPSVSRAPSQGSTRTATESGA